MATRKPRGARPAPGSFAVGVDRGGTWLRIVALDSQGRRRSARREAPAAAGLPAALQATWRRWGLRRGDVAALVVASRGVWTGTERLVLARRLDPLALRIRVLADVEAAYLGALGDRPGILLLAGTGSIALGRDERGRFVRAGGLGPLLGDEGSAFWVAREWLRARSRAGPDARRTGQGLALARRLARGDQAVSRIAALAPTVFRRARRGDRVARAVVTGAQRELAALLLAVFRRLSRAPSVDAKGRGRRLPVSWAGGLLALPHFRSGVWSAARHAGLDLVPTRPQGTALDAALALAGQTASQRPRTHRRRASPADGRQPGSAPVDHV